MTDKTQPAAGPWTFDSNGMDSDGHSPFVVRSSTGKVVAEIHTGDFSGPSEQWEDRIRANGRILAASPTMLDTLERLAIYLEHGTASGMEPDAALAITRSAITAAGSASRQLDPVEGWRRSTAEEIAAGFMAYQHDDTGTQADELPPGAVVEG